MSDDKAITFVRRVCEKTHGGQVPWEKTPDPDTFQAAIGGYVVTFEKIEARNGTVYTLNLHNSEGQVIDSYDDETLDKLVEPADPTEVNQFYYLMRDAFTTARRGAMGVDKALDDILEELK